MYVASLNVLYFLKGWTDLNEPVELGLPSLKRTDM